MSNFVTLWTVALQSPLSMGFYRQEYWSGLPCPPQRYATTSLKNKNKKKKQASFLLEDKIKTFKHNPGGPLLSYSCPFLSLIYKHLKVFHICSVSYLFSVLSLVGNRNRKPLARCQIYQIVLGKVLVWPKNHTGFLNELFGQPNTCESLWGVDSFIREVHCLVCISVYSFKEGRWQTEH